jgi:UDP-N-acetylmuramoyl-tripeptide--D-alanyl-D-alanine ligase
MIQSNIIWTAKQAAEVTQGSAEGNWSAIGLSIDSRTVKKGDLFIALRGEFGDGHDYVSDALSKGACAAMVSKEIGGVSNDQLLIVKDTLKAMQDLAIHARDRTAAKVVGITGSVGKTGTKEMLAGIFESQGQTHASVKSYNNHWGVPYSLASMHSGTDYGVFEMGMNHSNEISPLSLMVKPDVAIITMIAPVHIGNFDNGIDGIIDAKAEIFDGVRDGGSAVLNRDIKAFEVLKNKAEEKKLKVYSFGEHHEADAKLIECLEAANGTRVKANILGEDVSYTLQVPGKHLAMNSLSALLAVKLVGADIQAAAKSIEKQEPITGRGKRELLNIGQNDNPVTLIDESYNASPSAMSAAFKVLALVDPGRGGRRIAVLGDMLELGEQSDKYHEDLELPIKAANIDLVYTCGKHMKKLHERLPANQRGVHKENSKELSQIVPDVLTPGDVVMVKGSLGSKMGLIVEALRALPDKLIQKNKVK